MDDKVLIVTGKFVLQCEDETVWGKARQILKHFRYWTIRGTTVQYLHDEIVGRSYEEVVKEVQSLIGNLYSLGFIIYGSVIVLYNNLSNSITEIKKFTKSRDTPILQELEANFTLMFNHDLKVHSHEEDPTKSIHFLRRRNVKYLREKAQEHGIEGYNCLTKSELINHLI